MFHVEHFVELLRCEFVRKSGDAFADDEAGEAAASFRGDLLRCGECLEAGPVPLAIALLSDEQDLHPSTRASNFSFSTSLAAASFGVPVSISVFLVFRGT
jgi:hypothetical protein